MKIQKIHLNNLHNEEHFQFYAEFKSMVENAGAAKLKIQSQFDVFVALYDQEDEALKKITKSALTEQIEEADKQRDFIFRGLADTNKAALNHYNAEVREGARRLQIIFDAYGNIARKSPNKATAAIYNLLQELNAHSEEVDDVGTLSGWMDELERKNQALDELIKQRYDESAQRNTLVLKEVRAQVDDAYRAITERIDALMLIEGSVVYEEFIRRLNVVIEKYNNTLARRQGNSSKEKEAAAE